MSDSPSARPTHITRRKIVKIEVTDTDGRRSVFEGEGSMSTYNPNRFGEPTSTVLDITMKVAQ